MENEILHRVVTFLDRKELDFLDSVGKDILFSKGVKIARSTLLKELIDMFLNSINNQKFNYQELIDTIIKELSKGGPKCVKK